MDLDDLEQDIANLSSAEPFTCYEQMNVSTTSTFYLSGLIGEASEYVDMIHRIRTAGPGDNVEIRLNTIGGNLGTGVQIISAMSASEAKIETSIEGECYSLGSLIFLSGDLMTVNPHSLLMIHNFSGGVQGKGNDQISQLSAQVKWYGNMMLDIYYPFLSMNEINGVIKGEDIWMGSDEILERLENMTSIIEQENFETEKTPKKKKKKKK